MAGPAKAEAIPAGNGQVAEVDVTARIQGESGHTFANTTAQGDTIFSGTDHLAAVYIPAHTATDESTADAV